MARPQKDTVDYFPHDAKASSGDTIMALEGLFGNDGYAFWFKLLEHLASSEGHYIDCSNPKKWQLIIARAHVNHETGMAIMKLLVEMGAIDKDLWEKGIIWCQNLVNNVAEVYQNRRRPIPLRPVVMPLLDVETVSHPKPFLQPITQLLQETTPDNSVTTPDNSITTPNNPQSKVKETKVKESIVEETKLNSSVQFLPSEQIEQIKEIRAQKLKEVIDLYQERVLAGGTIPEDMGGEVTGACNRYSTFWVSDAIEEACAQGHPDWGYIVGILKNWAKYGKKFPVRQ